MHDFSDTRGILNRRPKIQFVEPEQVPGEQAEPTTVESAPALDRKGKLDTVIKQYQRLAALSDQAQKRVDSRAKGVKFCLDPIRDAAVIASLRRKFGDVAPCITYEQYKICLQELASLGQKSAIRLTPDDLKKAGTMTTGFGGYTKEIGGLRPELQFGSPVKPLDVDSFQKDSLKKLFQMLLPMLILLVDGKIQTHLLTAKHS